MREIKFSFMWQHQKAGTWLDKRYTLDEIIGGDPYDDMSDCSFLRPYHHMHIREFTGILDKNGKEIYEGDLVKVSNSSACRELYWLYEITTASAQFGNSLFAMLLEENVSAEEDGIHIYEVSYHNKGTRSFIPRNCEIIGNIYEDPELVKNGK